jgi:hypothetical protein
MKVTSHGRLREASVKSRGLPTDMLKAFMNGSRVDCKKRLHLEELEKAQISRYSSQIIFPWEQKLPRGRGQAPPRG